MEIGQVALLTAFTAGIISFLSPCVLAVLPTCTAFKHTPRRNIAESVLIFSKPTWPPHRQQPSALHSFY